jgi:hypothetical protein
LRRVALTPHAADGINKGRILEIFAALAESYALMRKLGLPDGIGYVGAELAQIMAMGSLRDEALGVLDEAEAAFQKLGKADGVAQVRQLREQISAP